MPRARDVFFSKFPGLKGTGQVKFKRPPPKVSNGYQLKLVKAPRYNNHSATTAFEESQWGFRRTGRKILFIVSPH